MRDRFDDLTDRLTVAAGSAQALAGAVLLVVVWAITGPLFRFSDTWQLFINTTTTVLTFWMVFVIQNSQNRDSRAVQLKLDELIRALQGARNDFIEIDKAPADELEQRELELSQLAKASPQGADADGGAPTLREPDRAKATGPTRHRKRKSDSGA